MERILPSYPLFIKDPNFSIWMGTELLNDNDVETWYGEKKKIYGFLKTNGETYYFMGDGKVFAPFDIKKAEQTKLNVTAFATEYEFACGKTTLKIRFVSPLPLTDLDLLSMPTCYMEYEIVGDKTAEISLFVNRNLCYNNVPETFDKRVRGIVVPMDGFETASFGLLRQMPLSPSADFGGADWGYYYLAGDEAWVLDENELKGYLANGYRAFVADSDEKYIGAINKGTKGAIVVAYDDRVSIDYYGDFRKGYYLEKHTIFDALTDTWRNRAKIEEKLQAFESDLLAKAEPYGQAYKNVLFASLRQSVGAHKLVRDSKGELLWLSKECGSNGCIATVDVSYPSMPLYLLYNPELVKGMMRPILDFARMPVWKYDFAPHDAGTYPVCGGQVYGVSEEKNKYLARLHEGHLFSTFKSHYPFYILPESFDLYDFNMQMPVEECANMLIMFLAVYQKDKDIAFFAGSKDLCEKWVQYLVKYGLKPGNQLCTDDFAGHLENNINLAIKATVGIGAYAELLKANGDKESAKYRKIAEEFAAEITRFGENKKHLPLTWDTGEETFSLKYNFAFDRVLGLGLFDEKIFAKEIECYLSKAERCGTPLDSRKMYTKSDWLTWVARLTDDIEMRKKFVGALDEFLKSSPDRVPFSDWYEGQTGEYHGFRARTTQGACFMLLL